MVIQKLTRSIKNRYLLFIITILIVLISVVFILQRSISLQNSNADAIRIAGNHSLLSHRIVHLISIIDDREDRTDYRNAIEELKETISLFEHSQTELRENHNNTNRADLTADSLLQASERYVNIIVASSKTIVQSTNLLVTKTAIEKVNAVESSYFKILNALSNHYFNTSTNTINRLKNTVYLLAVITFLILLGELVFVLIPALKQLFIKSRELSQINKELAISENRLKTSMLEQTKLRTDLKVKDSINKIFIEQAPTAIAMLDNNMHYMAVSRRWITDYKMEGQEVIGRSHYDVFPEIGDDWKEINKKCLNGAVNICDEAPFVRADGTVQWIYWDVRPWYIAEGKIGGILMHTGDITHAKEKEEENIRIQKILNKTNEVARIGTWDLDLLKGKVFWSKMVCEIHEVPEGYEPDLETSINFYKKGKNRDLVENAVKAAMEDGVPFDLEVELTTAKGATIWTRSIGQAQMVDGKCVRLFGMFQDIDHIKRSELALSKANSELKAVLNSGPIGIVSIDNNGLINHFNHGAEHLLGYTSSEVVGIERAEIFHLKSEIQRFIIDIAAINGTEPHEFNIYEYLAKRDLYDTREWTYIRKDGSTFPVQLTLSSVKNELGENIGFLGVSVDITERNNTKDELLKKNQLLNFAEQITMMGNWQLNMLTRKVKWSDNLYKIYELDIREEITFDRFLSFVHPEDLKKVHEHQIKLNESKVFDDLMNRIILKNGTIKTILSLGEVITNKEGEIIEIIGTCQDITQQRMAENKFRGLLESAPDAMIILNEEGKIQLINKQAEKLFGYSTKELMDKPANKLIPERFFEAYDSYLDNYFGSPMYSAVGVERELFGLSKEGLEIPVQISLSPLQTEEGILVSAAIRDITVQKIAKHELLQKNYLLNFAEKITMTGNWQTNVITKTVKWSANFYRIMGLEENTEVTFNTYLEHVHPEDIERVKLHQQNTLKNNKFEDLVHRIKLQDGTVKIVRVRANINVNEFGDIIDIIGTCQDITEQKASEQKIIQAKENLEVLTQHLSGQNKQLEDFAHISSHNLRSPVSNLNALLHLYRISETEEEREELFEKFETVISHLTTTLNTLIEALKTKKECEKELEILEFDHILRKTKEIISQKISGTNAIITSDFSKTPKIKYDKTYLESIFLNLVSNAVKYRSPNRAPEVHIKTEIIDGKIKLTFQDNGLGIDLKKHGHKLFGLNKTFHRHPEAKGVGLYLTKVQIESMGGKIYATSEVNKGSVFTVIFNENRHEEPL